MNMNQVNLNGFAANASAVPLGKDENVSAAETLLNGSELKTDTFEMQEPSVELGTYEKPKKLSADLVQQMEDQIYESMKALVEKTLGVQVGKSMTADELADMLELGKTPEEAAAAISEDGAWGVNAVSTRLLNMAIQLSGGDASKAEMLKEAVQKGFEAVGALEALPLVCQDTYTETMKRFDYWIEHGSMDGYDEDAVPPTAEVQ